MKLSFLHGFMGHSSDWDEVRAAMSNHETMAVDLPAAEDWKSSLRKLATCLPDQSVLIGYSMGARLALGMALEAPDRCQGLVFVSGSPGLESESERQRRREADQRVADRLAAESREQFLSGWYELPVFAGVSRSVRDEEMDRKLKRDMTDWRAILHANSVAGQPNYWPELDRLSMPVLIMAGQRDDKYLKILDRFEREAPSVDLKKQVMPNCGHIVHREEPVEFVNAIRRFLAEKF